MAVPKTHKQWTIQARKGIESLKLDEAAPVPVPVGSQVLVKSERFHLRGENTIHRITIIRLTTLAVQGASLNFRDLISAGPE